MNLDLIRHGTDTKKDKIRNQIAIAQLLADAARIPETWARWKPLIEQPAAVAS